MPDIETLVLRARHHLEEQQPVQAKLFYQQILKATDPPKTPVERVARGEAAVFCAREALYRQRLGEAGDWYRIATDADPLSGDHRAELVTKVLIPLGLLRAAQIEAKRAAAIEPESAKAWLALGAAELELEHIEESRAARKRALELRPDDSYLMLELARLELDAANYNECERLAFQALESDAKREGDALHFLAMIAYRTGRHREAIALYTRAIDAGCSDNEAARFNRALPEHALGMYVEGWADYEARGSGKHNYTVPFLRFAAPLLTAGVKPPARVLVHEEMGFGDTLAMARYVPMLASQGFNVQVEVREELLDLFQGSFPQVEVVPRALDYPGTLGLRPFDYHLPMLSFPHLFGSAFSLKEGLFKLTAMPCLQYLRADPELTAGFDRILPRGRRIGICWSAGIREGVWLREYGRLKSMAFRDMRPITDTDAHFVSLQLGLEADEASSRIIRVLKAGDSWAKTAALVENLSLVITVDTALSHLVGAMGKPVWVLTAEHAASWHWMTAEATGNRSPWYPTAKLYRQTRSGVWADVIDQVVKDLKA